jgi:hypothetical protein
VRWPWVSRRSFELLQHNYDQLRHAIHSEEQWAATLERSRSDYNALLDKYHALKLQGASAPDPILAPATRKELDPIVQQINVLSAGKPGLRATMMAQLNSDRIISGLSDAEIMKRIESGVTADDGIPA